MSHVLRRLRDELKFGRDRRCSTGDTVVEEQDSTRCLLNPPVLFTLKKFTIRRTLTGSPMKRVRSCLHTVWVMNDKTLVKKPFASPSLKQWREGGEKKNNYNGNCKAFCVTRKCEKIYLLVFTILSRRSVVTSLSSLHITTLNDVIPWHILARQRLFYFIVCIISFIFFIFFLFFVWSLLLAEIKRWICQYLQ